MITNAPGDYVLLFGADRLRRLADVGATRAGLERLLALSRRRSVHADTRRAIKLFLAQPEISRRLGLVEALAGRASFAQRERAAECGW